MGFSQSRRNLLIAGTAMTLVGCVGRLEAKLKNLITPKKIDSLEDLAENEVYFALLKPNPNNENKQDDFIANLDKQVGYSGYWHVELLFNGTSYGTRPDFAFDINFEQFKERFKEYEIEIRHFNPLTYITKFSIDAQKKIKNGKFHENVEDAIYLFKDRWWMDRYDVLKENCTDVILDMLIETGLKYDIVGAIELSDLKQDEKIMSQIRPFYPNYTNDQIEKNILRGRNLNFNLRRVNENYKRYYLIDKLIFPGAYEKISILVMTLNHKKTLAN